jgi:hypothetical protein
MLGNSECTAAVRCWIAGGSKAASLIAYMRARPKRGFLAPFSGSGALGVSLPLGVWLPTTGRTSGRPVVTGYTADGRLILVVYEEIDDVTVYPVTAYEVQD